MSCEDGLTQKTLKIIHLGGLNFHVHPKNTREIGQAIKGMLIWKGTKLIMFAVWQGNGEVSR